MKVDSSYFAREMEGVELLLENELSAATGLSTPAAETVSLLSWRRLVRTETRGETFDESEEATSRVDSWQDFAAKIEWVDTAAIGREGVNRAKSWEGSGLKNECTLSLVRAMLATPDLINNDTCEI